MEVTCPKCNAKYPIPDDKLPKGKVVNLKCRKCGQNITIDTRTPAAPAQPPAPAANGAQGEQPKAALIEEVSSGKYDAADKPFDYVEEGAATALVCDPDPAARAAIRAGLEQLRYHVTEPQSARDALKQMRFHVFDLVVLNEMFDTEDPDNNHVLKYIARLPISTRRHMFVALLSDRFRTMDNMAAFTKSVNVVISSKNIDETDKVLKSALSEHKLFYRVFFDLSEKMGKL